MKRKIIGFFMITLITLTFVSEQETVKVMFYNLLNSPLENSVPSRTYSLSYVLSDYKPDFVLISELNNIIESSVLLNTTKIAVNSNTKQYIDVSDLHDDLYYLTISRSHSNPLNFIIL